MAQYWLSNPWSNPLLESLDQLRRELDPLLDRAGAMPQRRAGAYPPVNLYEAGDVYVLTAELPGLRNEDIDVSIERNFVTLRGERRVEHPSDASLHRVERQGGIFRRTIEMPVEVDAEKSEASYRDGVLMLRIPKAEAHQPRRIAVQGS